MEELKNKIGESLPGLRNIKTVTVILVCLIIYHLIERNPFLACTEAILTLQGTMNESLKVGTDRIFATVFGGVIGIIFVSIHNIIGWYYINYILAPLGIFIIIYMCSKIIKRPEFVVVACVCFLGINIDFLPTHQVIDLSSALLKMGDTLIGVTIAMIINMYNPIIIKKAKKIKGHKNLDENNKNNKNLLSKLNV